MGGTRRRGTALEEAILDAAWAELTEVGYAQLTMAAVADRAGTSKPVVYRRWPGKAELVGAVIARKIPRLGLVRRTGDLRSDLLTALDGLIAGCRGFQIIAELDPQLAARLRRNAADEATAQLANIVAAAGFDPAVIGPRVLRLPAALIQHDLFDGTGSTDPAAIVDQIFLPLLHLGGSAASHLSPGA